MGAWRLVPQARAGTVEEAFSGKGSFLYGQRWNLPGHRIVYLSSHLSLAALEVIVHASTYHDLAGYRAFKVQFAADLLNSLESDLPPNWNSIEPTLAIQELGSRWAEAGESLLLRVPSAVVPVEYNYLLNVDHPAFEELAVDGPLPFRFDPRFKNFNLIS